MATNSSSSKFQRKMQPHICKIPGTKPSIHNSLLLTSSGVPSLDSLIGGGIPVGTVLLVGNYQGLQEDPELEEDLYGTYSNVLMKYFLAEGIASAHSIYLASRSANPSNLIKSLPCVLTDADSLTSQSSERKPNESTDDVLKIAWKYREMPKVQSCSRISQFGHYFDLSKAMDSDLIEKANITFFQDEESESEHTNLFEKLARDLKGHIESGNFTTSTTMSQNTTILRIALHSLCSPFWDGDGDTASAFCKFLYSLRALVRYSLSVCMVTVPTHLLHDEFVAKRIERMSDIVLRLESFSGSDRETNPVFKDYQGLFHIVKIAAFNSLAGYKPISSDFGIKLRRKKFSIEILHLPPELPETTNRRQEEADSMKSTSCSRIKGTGSKLEF